MNGGLGTVTYATVTHAQYSPSQPCAGGGVQNEAVWVAPEAHLEGTLTRTIFSV